MSLVDSTTRSLQIVSGSTTTTFTAPNRFTYRMPASGYRTGRDEVALKSLTLYYSWPNISAARGNNSFSYVWPATGLTYSVVLADGIWQFDQILSYLQQVMQSNGHYLMDSSGEPRFYLTYAVNSVLYCLSLTATPLPTTLPAGWTNPAGVDLATAAGKVPQLIVPAGFSSLTGFAIGSYPAVAGTALYQVNSGVPQITEVTSLNVTSNLVDNSGFSLTPNILASFVVPGAQSPGSLIQLQPNNLDWIPVQKEQTFTEITIEIVDQLMKPVLIRDPQGFVLTLNLRRR